MQSGCSQRVNLHCSSVIDQLYCLIIQPLAGLLVFDHGVDGLSAAMVVMINGEAERPCLSKGSVGSPSVPGTPVPVSPTLA